MTQEQSLLKHLTEKVMGWFVYESTINGKPYMRVDPPGRTGMRIPEDWSPLRNANHTLEVLFRSIEIIREKSTGTILLPVIPIGRTKTPAEWRLEQSRACALATGWEEPNA